MKHAEKITPIAAALGAVSTLACCLPLGFTAAIMSATLGAAVAQYRSWFLTASVVLLLVGGFQYAHLRRSCSRRGTASLAILSASAVVVCLVLFFPQVIAGLVADWMP